MKRLASLIAVLILAAGPAPGEGEKNLVENPSFEMAGEKVPKWTQRRLSGLTWFTVEKGRLVAERKQGASTTWDALLQFVYLPRDTKAVRVRVKAATEGLTKADLQVRYKDRNGNPIGYRTVLHFKGTHGSRWFDSDARLPAETNDVEIVFRMLGPGKLILDEVDVRTLKPSDARGEARMVEIRGEVKVRTTGTEELPVATVRVPVPPPTETQAPVLLTVESFPKAALKKARLDLDEGEAALRLEVGPVPPGQELNVRWTTRVLLTEREGFDEIPRSLPVAPVHRLSGRIAKWVEEPPDKELDKIAAQVLKPPRDLLFDGERVADYLSRSVAEVAGGALEPAAVAKGRRGSPAGRANLAVSILRRGGVPSRTATLVRVGRRETLTVRAALVWHEDLGWVRLGLRAEDPRPLPFYREVFVAAGAHGTTRPPESPTSGPAEEAEAVLPFSAEEVATVVLERKAGADLVESLFRCFKKAARRFEKTHEARVGPDDLVMKGRAKKMKDRLAAILEE